jgi:hypothetical protein
MFEKGSRSATLFKSFTGKGLQPLVHNLMLEGVAIP